MQPVHDEKTIESWQLYLRSQRLWTKKCWTRCEKLFIGKFKLDAYINHDQFIYFSQSLKRSADFELCRASDIEKLARTSTSMEASLSTSQIKETVDENLNVVEEITEDIPEEKQTEIKEVKKDKTQEPQKSVTPVAQNTVTVVAQIENDIKQKSNVEESEYETDTDESEVTVYNRPVEKPQTTAEEAKESDENAKKPSKTVTIDDEKNEEKVYRLDLKSYYRN